MRAGFLAVNNQDIVLIEDGYTNYSVYGTVVTSTDPWGEGGYIEVDQQDVVFIRSLTPNRQIGVWTDVASPSYTKMSISFTSWVLGSGFSGAGTSATIEALILRKTNNIVESRDSHGLQLFDKNGILFFSTRQEHINCPLISTIPASIVNSATPYHFTLPNNQYNKARYFNVSAAGLYSVIETSDTGGGWWYRALGFSADANTLYSFNTGIQGGNDAYVNISNRPLAVIER